MLSARAHCRGWRRPHGTSLVELLVALVVAAFGVLGLAAFQSKAQVGSLESYQRAQASVLLQDMQSRLLANSANAAQYVTAAALGTGDAGSADCAALAAGAARDKCEWSLALQGAAEQKGSAKVGAMQGARGCVAQVQAQDSALGVCRPAVYLVTVAWQGQHLTRAPAQACGKDQYGDDRNRRALSVRLSVGLPTCS